MNFVFLGPPGSGKGTQAKRVCEKKKILHLSTGDVLREAVKNGTELGKKAKAYMEAGDLVPDTLIVGIIEDKLKSGALDNGFVLDGFPRTVPQARALKNMFVANKKRIDAAILLDVPDEEVVKRLSGRFTCPVCGAMYNYPNNMPKKEGVCDKDGEKLIRRPDDEESVVRNRLDVYKQQTEPIVDFYRKESILREVTALGSIDSITTSVLKIMEEAR
jgi:adenylate kinase